MSHQCSEGYSHTMMQKVNMCHQCNAFQISDMEVKLWDNMMHMCHMCEEIQINATKVVVM